MKSIDRVRIGFLDKPKRGYDLIDGELKYGYIGKKKFEFIKGSKYQVSHQNPAKTLHKGAVGVYMEIREGDEQLHIILKCCNKRFPVSPDAVIPYDGEITKEHLKLISPLKKVHLLKDGRCACKCDSGHYANPSKMPLIDFMEVPENSRCTNCNHLA